MINDGTSPIVGSLADLREVVGPGTSGHGVRPGGVEASDVA
jgi:hypothetical protein